MVTLPEWASSLDDSLQLAECLNAIPRNERRLSNWADWYRVGLWEATDNTC
jgi:hypothetical protein